VSAEAICGPEGEPRGLPDCPCRKPSPEPNNTSNMAKVFLAFFLVIFGLNLLFGINIPVWVTGVLALMAGVLLLMEYFSVRVDRK
jgi:uncharacterized membrane protein HdeD (DUF308 family)